MKPITAKGAEYMPKITGRVKEEATEVVSVRFVLTKSDMKAVEKLAFTIGLTMKDFVKLKVRQAVNPELRVGDEQFE